jgi:heat shock protein HtpX
MEMCIDDPRSGFANIFDTHPSVDARVDALVKFAGGHDPGPLALAPPDGSDDDVNEPPADGPSSGPADGPWGSAAQSNEGKPFLPDEPPTGGGPWGPRRG